MAGILHKNWIEYWRNDYFWRDSGIFKINAELFCRQAAALVRFKKDDTVLDIGCGVGYIEESLAPVVKSIHALDVSEQFADLCRARCKDCDNVNVGVLKDTGLDPHKQSFSLILCVSVIQYLRDMVEVESLIRSMRQAALPGGRALIADIPRKRSLMGFIWDMLCSLVLSLRLGYASQLVGVALRKLVNDLRNGPLYGPLKELSFTEKDLESLIRRMGLDAEIIQKDFSVYANRLSLLIKF